MKDDKSCLQSLPKLYHEICHLGNGLHPRQSHQHEQVHFQKKHYQHCMKNCSDKMMIKKRNFLDAITFRQGIHNEMEIGFNLI